MKLILTPTILAVLILLAGCAKPPAAPAAAGGTVAAEPGASALVQSFAALPAVENVRLSPSGNYLAFFRHEGEQTFLMNSDLRTNQSQIALKTGLEKLHLAKLRWVDDERLLVGAHIPSTRDKINSVEGRLIAVNRDGTALNLNLIRDRPPNVGLEKTVFFTPQFQDNVLSAIADDPKNVLISLDYREPLHPDVYRLNVYSGEQELVQRNNLSMIWWGADGAGNLRLGKSLQKNSGSRIYLKSYQSGDWREWRAADAKGVLGFAPKSDWLYYVANKDGRAAIFKTDISAANSKAELVAADPAYDIAGPLIYAQKGGQPVGALYAADGLRSVYWDQAAKTSQERIDRALPGRSNLFLNHSADGLRHIVHSSAATQPPEVYLFDETGNTLDLIAETYPQLKPEQLSATRPINFKARDGLSLQGYLTLPKAGQGKALPTVVLPHGGPASRDIDDFNYWSQFLAAHGWAVLQVNFRSSSGFGEEFMRAGFQRWGLEMQDDISDGVQWLIDQQIADPKKICIVGGSYGGYAALMGAVKTPELYRCAASFAGLSDLQKFISYRSDFFTGGESAEKQFGNAWTDRQRLKDTSPVEQVKRIRTPLLLVHGEQDRVVPVEQSRDMAEALREIGYQDFRYVELPWADHHLSRSADRMRFFSELEQFLSRYLD